MRYYEDNKPGFSRIDFNPGGAKFRKIGTAMTVIVSIEPKDDGKRWLHVSAALPSRLPRHDEQAEIKEKFIGQDEYAISVFPPKEMHVNIHPHCLHLWHCLEGHPLPEFSGFINGMRSI